MQFAHTPHIYIFCHKHSILPTFYIYETRGTWSVRLKKYVEFHWPILVVIESCQSPVVSVHSFADSTHAAHFAVKYPVAFGVFKGLCCRCPEKLKGHASTRFQPMYWAFYGLPILPCTVIQYIWRRFGDLLFYGEGEVTDDCSKKSCGISLLYMHKRGA